MRLQAAIVAALDHCLASDAELQEYYAARSADIARLELEATVPPRFPPGAAVACNMGGDEWAAGWVTRQYHREEEWPLERWSPYQARQLPT